MAETNTNAQQLLEAADRASEDARRLLVDLLRFPTVNSRDTPEEIGRCKAEVKRCFEFLRTWCESNGFRWRNYDDLVCVAEIPGDGEETIGVPLHVDVVPVDLDKWTHPPFAGEIADGYIFGRGTQDDKGPTAAMLMAAKLVKDAGVPFRRTLKLIVGSAEETGEWEDMARYLKEEPAPTFSVVPDGEFPVINGEKGFLTLKFNGAWEIGEVSGETGLEFVSLKSGRVENIIPELAVIDLFGGLKADDRIQSTCERIMTKHPDVEIEVESKAQSEWVRRFNITVKGRAAHAALPHLGVNAATIAIELLYEILGAGKPARPFLKFLMEISKGLNGEGLGIDQTHDFIGRTTSVLTVLNVQDDKGEARINIRFPIGLTSEEILAKARALATERKEAKACGVTVEPRGAVREPIFVDPDQFQPYIDALRASYEDVQGREAKLMAIGGTTFAKAMPNAVCYGPVDEADGEEQLAHQADERVSVEHFQRNLKIYTLALARLVSGDNSLGAEVVAEPGETQAD